MSPSIYIELQTLARRVKFDAEIEKENKNQIERFTVAAVVNKQERSNHVPRVSRKEVERTCFLSPPCFFFECVRGKVSSTLQFGH